MSDECREVPIEDFINTLIRRDGVNAEAISDGYHTFGELYEHRFALFIALCRRIPGSAWKARKHHDGSGYDGWFIVGLMSQPGQQITYHLPDRYWEKLGDIHTFEQAPVEFDGHTPADVVERLWRL